jgi:hypothetical protein
MKFFTYGSRGKKHVKSAAKIEAGVPTGKTGEAREISLAGSKGFERQQSLFDCARQAF